MPRPAKTPVIATVIAPAVVALLLTGAPACGAASPDHAASGAASGSMPGGTAAGGTLAPELPTLSSEPALAQRQALGCSIVGLGLTGLALASGVAASGGGAAASGPAIAELLAYFGAGCTMGAFIATAFPTTAGTETTTPAQLRNRAPALVPPLAPDPNAEKRRLRVEAAALIP